MSTLILNTANNTAALTEAQLSQKDDVLPSPLSLVSAPVPAPVTAAAPTKPDRAVVDSTRLLEMMADGLLVTLHITRPSFLTSLTFDDLAVQLEGPKEGPEVAASTSSSSATSATSKPAPTILASTEGTEAFQAEINALKSHVKLGVKRLLPEELYKRLLQAEDRPRRILYKYSVSYRDTSRGNRFIPGNRYSEWAEENEKARQSFWELAREIEANYPVICQQVIENYRKIAEFAWRQHFKSRLAVLSQSPTGKSAAKAKALKALVGEKESFIEGYLSKIKRSLPALETIKRQFAYEYRVNSLALPLEIATNVAVANELKRTEELKGAELRAKLAELRAEEEKQQAEVWAKRQVEQEKARLEGQKARKKLELDIARLERAQKLQEEYLAQVRAQKEAMLTQFWDNLVAEINQTIMEGTKAALEGLDKNEGRLPGRSRQGLVSMLEKLSAFREYLQDHELAAKIEQLYAVLPPSQAPVVGGRRVQLDTTPLRRVLEGMQREAEVVLVELEGINLRSSEQSIDLAQADTAGEDRSQGHRGSERLEVVTTATRPASASPNRGTRADF
jgi:hypothetical protein